MSKNNLRVSNLIMTGKLPFKRKMNRSEQAEMIDKASYHLINEEICPILIKRMPIRQVDELSVHRKVKGVTVSIWASGAINIVGLISVDEGDIAWDMALKDIKEYSRGVL